MPDSYKPRELCIVVGVKGYHTFTLQEFNDWFNGLINSVPEEHKASVIVEITDDDGNGPQLYIWYKRIETQEEVDARHADDELNNERRKEREIIYARNILTKYGKM